MLLLRLSADREEEGAWGFTLVELMISVVIVGVLAGIATYVYGRYLKSARANEIPQMFGEFKIKEETYAADVGSYWGTGTETGGGYWPTPLKSNERMAVQMGRPAAWKELRIQPMSAGLYCQYMAVAGAAGSNAGMGTVGTGLYGGAVPSRNWYYLLAQCDWDGDSSVNSIYTMRGDRTDLIRKNEGR